MRDYDKKKALVLDGEESFARAVALGVHVKKPLSVWHFLLPGMFLFDFLRRSSETKRDSELFLSPRKLALDGALDLLQGEERKRVCSQIEERMKQWLISLELYSDRLLQAHMGEITLLVDHYVKLLRTEEGSYHGLIQQAYSTREHYETFLTELGAAEREIDEAVAEFHGGSAEIWQRLHLEQAQVAELRKKEVKLIF